MKKKINKFNNENFIGFNINNENISKEYFNKCFIEEFNIDKESIKNNKNKEDFMSVYSSNIIGFTIVYVS